MKQHRGQFTASLLGLVGAIVLHSVFFAFAMWGDGLPSQIADLPDAVGTGANRGSPDGESFERRIVVRIISDISANPEPTAMDAFLEDALKAPAKIHVTGPDAIPLPPLLVEEDGAVAESADAELIAREKMVGIYQSQIRARIERAWASPAEMQPEKRFTCRALIRQNRDGRVREVELPYETCDGTPAMRQSVINAIFSASPLPAPPHPGVFVDSFSLVLRPEAAN